MHDRQVFNLAVVMAGLDYLGMVLKDAFGDQFAAQMERLRGTVFDHRAEISTTARSEASKALDDMSMISRTENPDSEFAIREGYEYLVGEGYVEIMLRETFVKYFSWCKRKGFTPLYTSAESFISAMGKSPAVVDKTCFDSKLRGSSLGGLSRIFRFNLEKLAEDGVEPFRTKA